MSEPVCNCPPLHDVFRHRVYTKPPCPVHPEPEGLAGMLQERIPVEGMKINTNPLGDVSGGR